MNDFEKELESLGMTLQDFEKEALEGLKELHKNGEFLDISEEKAKQMLREK